MFKIIGCTNDEASALAGETPHLLSPPLLSLLAIPCVISIILQHSNNLPKPSIQHPLPTEKKRVTSFFGGEDDCETIHGCHLQWAQEDAMVQWTRLQIKRRCDLQYACSREAKHLRGGNNLPMNSGSRIDRGLRAVSGIVFAVPQTSWQTVGMHIAHQLREES